jgi:hypothetical protein
VSWLLGDPARLRGTNRLRTTRPRRHRRNQLDPRRAKIHSQWCSSSETVVHEGGALDREGRFGLPVHAAWRLRRDEATREMRRLLRHETIFTGSAPKGGRCASTSSVRRSATSSSSCSSAGGPTSSSAASCYSTRPRGRSRHTSIASASRCARCSPFDCAGEYGIEDAGIHLLARIAGDDPTGIEGLPLMAVARMLRAVGYAV